MKILRRGSIQINNLEENTIVLNLLLKAICLNSMVHVEYFMLIKT